MWHYFKPSYFISEIDKFLQGFRKNHPQLSLSQRKEQEKHLCIEALRDKKEPTQHRAPRHFLRRRRSTMSDT
ncbi:MAG: hypothetical protein A3E83_02430 [Gammaproteobacteria bacterium RIFCSPHIGHO2_12_FULL_41_20]|nr:MAG: hypothetical protein A3E83_02430 [Gammaproteobacteria bacterium RIFCSPHIGHO2_12_FULL_41_20]